jgi:iron complex outermembrane recepter protein
MPSKNLNIIVLLFLISQTAVSQEVIEEVIEEVTVTGLRIDRLIQDAPISITVVDSSVIQNGKQNLGIDESLSRVPGLFMQNRYNFSGDLRVSIRGFGARSNFGIRGVKIIVDGIPETLPDGQGQVDNIDLSSISSIEVIRGPSSALYGNASGGVINITSESFNAPFTRMSLSSGSYGYKSVQAKRTFSLSNNNIFFSLSEKKLEGYREHSEHQNRQLSLKVASNLSNKTSLTSSFHLTSQPISNDPGGLNTSQVQANRRSAYINNVTYNAGESYEQARIGSALEHIINNQLKLHLRGYVVDRNFEARLPLLTSGYFDIDRSFNGLGADINYAGNILNLNINHVIGFDLDNLEDYRKSWNNIGGTKGEATLDQLGSVKSFGMYVQSEILLTESSALTLGLRRDEVNFEVNDYFLSDLYGDESGQLIFNDTSPLIAFNHKLNDQTSIYLNRSTSFETPTTSELANPIGGGFNNSIRPQDALSKEVGIRHRSINGIELEAAYFNIDVTNELIPFELDSMPGRNFYENSGSSYRKGLELSLKMPILQNLSMILTHTNGQYRFKEFGNFNNNYIPGIPAQVTFFELTHRDVLGTQVTFDALSVSDQYTNNSNSSKNPGYTHSNLVATKSFSYGKWQIEPFVGIYNVLDEKYNQNVKINAYGGRFFEPAPTRNVFFGINFDHNY